MQSAFQVLVSSNRDLLANDTGDLWDSRKVLTDASAFVSYQGIPLNSRMQCYWKVKVWDESENESEWSAIASWIMGIFHEDWEGEWIGERTEVLLRIGFLYQPNFKIAPIGLEKRPVGNIHMDRFRK